MQDLTPEDVYQLRKSQMDADKKALESQRAQQELERLVLELEHKYNFLAEGKSLDPRTAVVTGGTPSRRSNGKDTVEALMGAAVNETSV